MEAYEAIITRRSVPRVAAEAPAREEIEKLLRAAVRAPTHHVTEPWRFVVLKGSARDEFGEAWAAAATRLGEDPEVARAKPRRAPVILAVIERPKHHLPKVLELEEHYATGAAMQNILLAAHALGLGAMLRTGPAVEFPEVRGYLGLELDELIAGFVYLGFPEEAGNRPMTRRKDPAETTEWRGWE